MNVVAAIFALLLTFGCGVGLFETPAPRLITNFIPANGDIEVDVDKPITFLLPAPIDPTTLNEINVNVSSGGVTIPGTFAYNASSLVVTFTPTDPYPQKSIITVTIFPPLRYADSGWAFDQSISFTTLSNADLIAMWKFDNNGIDSSGHGRDLIMNNVTYDSTAQYEGAASAVFDGSTAYGITAGAVDLASQFSITVWVKLSNPIQASCNGILTNVMGGLNTDGFKVFVNRYGTSDLTINTEAGDGTNGATLTTQNGFATVASWKQVAFTVDKTADPTQRALFYFDGQPANQYVSQTVGSITTFPNVFETNSSIVVGAFKTPHLFFNGEMDDMRVYNGVLTPAQVLRISQQQ